MELNSLWDWEKQKLTADIDLRQLHLEQGALGDAHDKRRHGGDLSTAEANINKQHFTSIRKVPFQRQLNSRLDVLKKGSERATLPQLATSKRRPRRTRKLASISHATNQPEPPKVVEEESVQLAGMEYKGDLFGTRGDYSGSMLYRSRIAKGPVFTPGAQLPPLGGGGDGDASSGGKGGGERGSDAPDATADGDRDLTEPEGGETDAQNEAKQRCAITLRNWSFHSENRHRLLKEGAERALMQLARVPDAKTRACCATAFRNLASEPSLRRQLVKAGCVRTIVSLSNAPTFSIVRDCLLALCHLSNLSGGEAALVDDGAVVTLQYIMQENARLAPLCARTLFNLTVVEKMFDRIERVVKTFMTLGGSPMQPAEIKDLCVKALCNLSNSSRVQARMVDENVVSVLATLGRGSDNSTKKLCAVVLQNLASVRGCRAELVKKGAVQVLLSLADTDDEKRQHWAAIALCKLIQDRGSRARIVEEGAITALSAIAKSSDRFGRFATTRICSGALLTLCSFDESKQLVVDRGAVPVLIQLAKSEDALTKQNCTLGLCSLLSLQDSAIYIMQQGAVSALVQLSNTDNEGTRASCATVLYNLSCQSETGQLVVKEGFVPAILALSKAHSFETKAVCAATLCNLASVEPNRRRMVDERVVPTLVTIMENANEAGDAECVRNCTSALCSLSLDPVNTEEIVKDLHVLRVIAQTSWEGDETKRSMCTVLANLTFLQASRSTLAQLGAVGSLLELAALDDDNTRQRCSVAFCNLSCEATIRGKMVDDGVVTKLGELSNSYSEENQQDCAKAFCNLSCHEGTELRIVEEGAVGALMMIAMVRSVKTLTKDTCAKALLNLMTPASLSLMIDQGLVQALTSLAKLPSECCMSICAHGFCLLTADAKGCAAVAAKPATLASLFSILRRTVDDETRFTAGKAIFNLLVTDETRELAVSADVVPVLRDLVVPAPRTPVGEKNSPQMTPEVPQESTVHCANALFLLSRHETSRASLLKHKALNVVVDLCTSSTDEHARLSCARALMMLAWHKETCGELATAGALPALVRLVDTSGQTAEAVRQSCTRALCNLALYTADGGATRRQMIEAGVVQAAVKLFSHTQVHEVEARSSLGMTVRCLASTLADGGCADGAANAFDDDSIALLVRLAKENANDNEELQQDCAVALCDLAFCADLSERLVRGGAHRSLMDVAAATKSEETRWRCAAALRFLSAKPANCSALIRAGCVKSVVGMCFGSTAGSDKQKLNSAVLAPTLSECAAALCALSSVTANAERAQVVSEGAVPLLIELSHSNDDEIVSNCSVGLSNLSSASTAVDEGTVTALISMSLDFEHAASGDADESAAFVRPPALPTRDLPKPSSDESAKEVSATQTTQTQKLDAGQAGEGPPPPTVPLLEVRPLNAPATNADGSGSVDPGDGDEDMVSFQKMAVTQEIEDALMDDDDAFSTGAGTASGNASAAGAPIAATAANAAALADAAAKDDYDDDDDYEESFE